MRTAGRPDLADDPRLRTNDGRVEHEAEIDAALPGRTDWTGPALGAHDDEILRGRLGLSDDELADLRRRGIVAAGGPTS